MSAAKDDLSIEELRLILSYEKETGIFRWIAGIGNVPSGAVAGWLSERGYWLVGVKSRIYRGHRLAWALVTGDWPRGDIDHKDGDRSNNIFSNLREATRGQNLANKKLEPSRNRSGYKGVSWCSKKQKWAVYLKKDRKSRFFGYFDDRELAHAAYCRAAESHFGEFARFI